MATTDVLAKIERARTRLMATDPFFGALALKLRIRATDRHPIMATDGTHLFYNPQGCAAISEPELMFVWAHEVLHCGLFHMYRKPAQTDWHEWNVCTDLAINALLIAKGVGTKPAGILHDPQYANLSAEQIAHARRKARQQQLPQPEPDDANTDTDGTDDANTDTDTTDNSEDEDADTDDGAQDADAGEDGSDAASNEDEPSDDGTEPDGTGETDADGTDPAAGESDSEDADADSDGTGSTGDAGEPSEDAGDGTLEAGDDCLPPATDATTDDGADTEPQTQTDWEMAVEQAAAVTRKAGAMDGGIERAIVGTRTTRTDWREILRRFVEATSPSDYTWQRANRRYLSQGLYLPGTSKANTPPIVVVVDTSGSVSQVELDIFASELTNILVESKPRAVHVIYCDTRVNGDAEVFTPDDGEVTLTTRGGGGTYFQPAFDWVADAVDDGTLDERPAAILYLTDGYAADIYSLTEPEIPTLFAIVPGGTTEMPFGEAIEMEVD